MEKKEHVDGLNIFAAINLIISIISAVYIWVNFSVTNTAYSYSSYTTTTINWSGIIAGAGVLLGGLTLYYTLSTIADIYERVNFLTYKNK